MHATEPEGAARPDTTNRRADGLLETDVDRRFFDLFDSDDVAETYGQNELDHDRVPTTDGFAAWCTTQATATVGYALTDAGLRALTAPVPGDESVTPALVLRNAARYLERYGWIQGAYYDATAMSFTPPACLVGAIGMVCYGGPVEAPAQHFDDPGFLDFEEAVLHLDRYLLVHGEIEAYAFNDAKDRTAEQVITVLCQAADTPAYELVAALRLFHGRDAYAAGLVGGDVA